MSAGTVSPASDLARRYGPWAVVTGASDGIGQAFAEHLAAEGFSLVLVARREDRLTALAHALQQRHGTTCQVLAMDLADAPSARQLSECTAALDVGLLVAAAGFGTSGTWLEGDLEQEWQMVQVNCAAVMAQSWHFGQRFARRGRGGVVLLSSLLGFHGTPGAAHYAATKAYVQSLAEGLRAEWAPRGVDVIAAAPGPIRSGFAARARMHMPQALPADVVPRATLQALGRQTTVRPGWLSKLLGWSLATLPRSAQVRVIAQVMKGMTTHPDRPAVP